LKIRINGKELDEGNDKDFTVDYQLGSVTFTPKVGITDEDLIRLEYEYKLFNYQRTLLGGSVGVNLPDSMFSLQGAIWSETDNKDQTIDLSLGDAQKAALASAGDHLPMASTARPVHPNDVAGQSQIYPLYKKVLRGSDSVFQYVPNDWIIAHPDSVFGIYYVFFRKVNPGEIGHYNDSFTDQRGALGEGNVFVVAGLRLGGRCENRLGQLVAFAQAGRKRDAADGSLRLVFLPAGAGQIAARYAFDVDHFGALHQHGAAFELIAESAERRGILIHLRRQKMRWRQVAQKVEPENRELGQHFALVRDAGGQNVVESRDAVGGDDEKFVAHAIDIAHFAASMKISARKIRFQNDRVLYGMHSAFWIVDRGGISKS